jgi:enamine deaminase RidA (YjgF/YER057c/UK114 family)
MKDGEVIYKGKVGEDLTIEEGKKASELCLLNVLNQLVLALDDDILKIKSCIKLEIFVNATESFEKHPEIANGASDLLVKVLGERGRHTRVAVGVSSLPLNSAVEVTAIFETAKERE